VGFTAVVLAGATLLATACRDDNSLLVMSARRGRSEDVQRLLADGVPVDVRDPEFGATALMWATHDGYAETVRILLAGGADVNAYDTHPEFGGTALMKAATAGHVDVVDLLLAAGAEPDAVDVWGTTALMKAVWRGHAAVAGRLLQVGADPAIVDDEGKTALDYAREAGRTELVEVLSAVKDGAVCP
jgi:ankyrin repeat protein